jgi:hypothetical protein
MTGAVEAAYRYHREQGVLSQRFHVTFVVSTRTGSSGQNAFTPVPVEVAGGLMDLAEFRINPRHCRPSSRRGAWKGPHGSGGDAGQPGARALGDEHHPGQARDIDFATSNLPAFPGDTYVAGARTLDVFAFGPLAGTAFNLTQLSVAKNLVLRRRGPPQTPVLGWGRDGRSRRP